MTDLFNRGFRVTIQDKQFGSFDVPRPLTFSFSVQRDKTLTPNNANILLTNLSEDTRAHLEELSGGFGQGTGLAKTSSKRKSKTTPGTAAAPQDKGITVRIEAGYGEDIGQIFLGVLRKCSSWWQAPEWLTQISGGDAEHSLTTAQVSKTWVAGTPITTVVRDLVTALKVDSGGLEGTLADLNATGLLTGGNKLQRPLTLHGDAATALESVMRSAGFEWYISDGAFYAGPAGTPTFPGEGPLLTAATGLIGVPQLDKKGQIVGKCLMNSDLLPGRMFRVESSRVTGNFLCVKTNHHGDSTGDAWYTDFVGAPPEPGSKAAG